MAICGHNASFLRVHMQHKRVKTFYYLGLSLDYFESPVRMAHVEGQILRFILFYFYYIILEILLFLI